MIPSHNGYLDETTDVDLESDELQVESPLNALDVFTGQVRNCGRRTKISAYRRLVLPAAYAG